MYKSISLVIGILLVFLGTCVAAQPPTTVFLLSFDNYNRDSEIDWLRVGFVEFIEDYLKNNYDLNVQRTTKIETELSRIKKETGGNYLLTGSYYREAGKFKVEIEVTDLNTWRPLGTRQIEAATTDFAQIIEEVNLATAELLGLRSPRSEEEPPTTALLEDSLRQALSQMQLDYKATVSATQKFSFALEQLDRHLYQTKEEEPIRRIVTQPQASKPVSDFLRINKDFNQVINYILQNPYEIEIGEPTFKRVPLQDDLVRVGFAIRYKLRRAIIQEMLETLPYRQKKDYATYTEYVFGTDKVIVEPDIRNRIIQGDYRSFPVITLTDVSNIPVFRICDLPVFTTRTLPPISRVKYENRFTPRLTLSASSWDVKIWLFHDDLNVNYEFDLEIAELQKVRNITVTVLPEKEALHILNINP